MIKPIEFADVVGMIDEGECGKYYTVFLSVSLFKMWFINIS